MRTFPWVQNSSAMLVFAVVIATSASLFAQDNGGGDNNGDLDTGGISIDGGRTKPYKKET